MSSKISQDKRFSWLIAATALNTIASLTALGLWFFAPNSNRNTTPTPASAEFAQAPPPPMRPSRPWPNSFPQPPPGQSASTPNSPNTPASPPESVGIFDPRGLSKTSNAQITPATRAVAERLYLDPQILTAALANDAGDLPPDVVKKLDHALEASTSLAKSRQLNEYQTQSLVSILTYYEFAVLREEKAAAPGPVDPSRLESIRERNLQDIATTCGEDTRQAAEKEIDRW
jgi:type IV secretory pathway VirB10-like protein